MIMLVKLMTKVLTMLMMVTMMTLRRTTMMMTTMEMMKITERGASWGFPLPLQAVGEQGVWFSLKNRY